MEKIERGFMGGFPGKILVTPYSDFPPGWLTKDSVKILPSFKYQRPPGEIISTFRNSNYLMIVSVVAESI